MVVVETPRRTLEEEIELLEGVLAGRESTEVGAFLLGAVVGLKWISRAEQPPHEVAAAMMGKLKGNWDD